MISQSELEEGELATRVFVCDAQLRPFTIRCDW